MKAVSPSTRPPSEVSRPFDGERDGFVLGEGAAVLVLESLRRAQAAQGDDLRRGHGLRLVVRRLRHHPARARGQGGGALDAGRRSARPAVDPADIDYINAHGTSTRLNDLMETVAVKRVFGHRAATIPMSSQKSMVGHLIGASGALEAAATALSLERGVVPPTINQATPDPDCDLDYVPNTAREIPLRTGDLQQLRLRRAERLAGHDPVLQANELAFPLMGKSPTQFTRTRRIWEGVADSKTVLRQKQYCDR